MSRGYALVDKKDYDEMTVALQDPTTEFLTEKAVLQGYTLIPKKEYDEITATVENPSREFLVEKAENSKLTLIPVEELANLKNQVEKPSLQYLQEKTLDHNRTLVPTSEYKSLLATIDEPDDEYLKQKAASKDLYIVPRAEYNSLTENLEKPNIDYVKEKARGHNHAAIPNAELKKMQDTVAAPSLEFLREKSQTLGFQVVETSEFERLKDRDNRTIEQLASETGQVVIDGEKLRHLQEEVENPSLNFLSEHARALGCILVPEIEYNSTVKQAQEPSVDHITEKASQLGYSILSHSAHESYLEPLEKKITQAGLIALTKEDHQKLLSLIESPSLDYLNKKAAEQGQLMIFKDKFEALRRKAAQHDEANAAGMVSIARPQFDELQTKSVEFSDFKKRLDEPSLEYIQDSADKLSLVVLSRPDYDKLKESLEQSIFDRAASLSMVAIPAEEFNVLKANAEKTLEARAAEENMALCNPAQLDQLKREYASPSFDKIKQVANAKGYTLIAASELEELRNQASQPIESKAASLGVALIPVSQYESMKLMMDNPSTQYLESKAAAKKKVIIDESLYEELKNDRSLSIEDRATNAGLVVLPVEEYADLHSKATEPSTKHLQKSAAALGYSIIPIAELSTLTKQANRTLDDHIQGTNLKTVDAKEYNSLLLKANKPSIQQITALAEKNGLAVVPKEELLALQNDAAESLETKARLRGMVLVHTDEYESLLAQLDKPSASHLKEKALVAGLCVLTASEYEQLKDNKQADIYDLAKEEGLVVVEAGEYKALVDDLANAKRDALTLDDADKLDLVKSKLRDGGFEVMTKEKYAFMNTSSAIDPEKLTEAAEKKGMIVMSEDAPSQGDIQRIVTLLENRGYSVVDKSEVQGGFADAAEEFHLNSEELAKSADRLGMVALDKKTYADLVAGSAPQDHESLKTAATALAMSVVPNVELMKMKQSLAESNATIFNLKKKTPNAEMTRETLLQKLRSLGLITLDKKEYQALKDQNAKSVSSGVMTEEDVRARAGDLGLSVVKASELNALKRSSLVFEDKKMFRTAAKKFGWLCVPETAFIPTTVQRQADPDKVTLVPTTYYNKLYQSDSLNIEKVTDDVFRQYAQKRGYRLEVDSAELRTPMVPPDADIDSLNLSPVSADKVTPLTNQFAPKVPRSQSTTSHLSTQSKGGSLMNSITGMSIATNISFTDRSMIPAITQVVIGEYLFKYYRKLGPFSSISADRHERYFWVHPYSLTLYWSSSNPVLANPADVKTKAVAILSVESVDDNNPLPTGLYHKSIVIHSQTKTVKFTCPTRQRHNIWYNALRYMVNRSIHELDFGRGANASYPHNRTPPDDDVPELDFESSTRHAFPRSSTVLRSSSNRRFNSLKP